MATVLLWLVIKYVAILATFYLIDGFFGYFIYFDYFSL